MYCSACGFALAQGQAVCPQCGRPVPAPFPTSGPPIPGFESQLLSYSNQLRALSIVWFVYAGLTLLFGFIGLAFAKAILLHHFGSTWMHGPWESGTGIPNSWIPLIALRFASVFLVGRAALAIAAGWGLYERAPWGRIIAVIAAVLCLLKFPLGTALGIWTLVMLLGYRNSTLYDRLPQS
jgi:hypothetical protein